ncbi:hypothetical protein BKA67DRAFT_530465 [Truncatella angustata]|uniref:Uncharacterized protein n=1 Tax=Truncatella angustata TaxID=152316 RepID=A0A9P8UYI6_9PEZI|nr:uncharacterized protein BKA67DRAFT_530465 [Truncatella angustata]KAH6660366.1 hypothetical protein BKA67DRAFT_530465 [Truncatella angustata]KAH8201882.1 hypothetical protein TruAng_003969 [Truncatella angustata]
MGGLLPLLLPSSRTNRASITAQPTDMKRPASVMVPQETLFLGHKRQHSLPSTRSMRRLTITTPASPLAIPATAEDWRKAVNDVKRKYVSRKYRTCSARCCDILDNLENTCEVETLHLVYLHFYAASSFEMCARPLSQSSAYRTKLLDDAREHYDKASALINKAEETATQMTRSASSASSAPSLGSSRSSSVCTTRSSPRNSFSSVEDLKATAHPKKPKKKKKVSFSGLPEIEIPQTVLQPEPFIRPDSPTLGWERADFLFGQSEVTAEVVAKPVPDLTEMVSPRTVDPVQQYKPLSPVLQPVPEGHQIEDPFDMESFLQTRSLNRMIAQLSALRSQVAWHRDNIDALMTEPDEIPEVPGTPTLPGVSSLPGLGCGDSPASSTTDVEEQISTPASAPALTAHALENALMQSLKDSSRSGSNFDPYPLFSGHPGAWDRSRSGSVASLASSALPPRAASAMSMRSGSGDEALQKRIERLRASGWQRKRFDSRRYEALREQVLTELGA